jgi:hypothetical protein
MSASSKKIVLKKLNSHNTIWHPDSTLVFKSQKDRLVIGRYVDDKIIPLDDVALTLCETWKFKPDESLFDDEDNEKVKPEECTDEEPTDEEPTDEEPTENIPDESTQKKVVEEESTQKKVVEEESTQKKAIEEESTTKKTIKEESGQKKLITEKINVKNITDIFTFQICEAFDNLNDEKSALTIELSDTKAILADLQKKYDDIKKKFDTMKSIFN